jgi:hypothetical protein
MAASLPQALAFFKILAKDCGKKALMVHLGNFLYFCQTGAKTSYHYKLRMEAIREEQA